MQWRRSPAFLRDVEMTPDEPALKFIGTHELADDEVIGPIVPIIGGSARQWPCLGKDELVGVQQSRKLIGCILDTAASSAQPRIFEPMSSFPLQPRSMVVLQAEHANNSTTT